jgi:large-conductance mechanosensitive channel
MTFRKQNFGFGAFLAAVITFIIVTLVIFFIPKITKRTGI